MPYETSKSTLRRLSDTRFATRYFVGEGIDVGCGNDYLGSYVEQFPLMTRVIPWDVDSGDGAYLATIPDESLHFVYASHSLEHMDDPALAFTNWLRVLKPGGHLILVVPDEDRFEQGEWPSQYSNGGHRTSWTIGKDCSWAPHSINWLTFLVPFLPSLEVLKLELLDSVYGYNWPAYDQTLRVPTECGIELIGRKRTPREIAERGRLPIKS